MSGTPSRLPTPGANRFFSRLVFKRSGLAPQLHLQCHFHPKPLQWGLPEPAPLRGAFPPATRSPGRGAGDAESRGTATPHLAPWIRPGRGHRNRQTKCPPFWGKIHNFHQQRFQTPGNVCPAGGLLLGPRQTLSSKLFNILNQLTDIFGNLFTL